MCRHMRNFELYIKYNKTDITNCVNMRKLNESLSFTFSPIRPVEPSGPGRPGGPGEPGFPGNPLSPCVCECMNEK